MAASKTPIYYPGIQISQFLPLFSDIIQVFEKVFKIYHDAEHNKRICGAIFDRVSAVEVKIRSLKFRWDEHRESFTQKNYTVLQKLCVESIEAIFYDLAKEFDSYIDELDLVISVDDECRKLEKQIIRNDIEDLNKYLGNMYISDLNEQNANSCIVFANKFNQMLRFIPFNTQKIGYGSSILNGIRSISCDKPGLSLRHQIHVPNFKVIIQDDKINNEINNKILFNINEVDYKKLNIQIYDDNDNQCISFVIEDKVYQCILPDTKNIEKPQDINPYPPYPLFRMLIQFTFQLIADYRRKNRFEILDISEISGKIFKHYDPYQKPIKKKHSSQIYKKWKNTMIPRVIKVQRMQQGTESSTILLIELDNKNNVINRSKQDNNNRNAKLLANKSSVFFNNVTLALSTFFAFSLDTMSFLNNEDHGYKSYEDHFGHI
ncbi:23164_t:CDS:2, partial [Racocetra persica]